MSLCLQQCESVYMVQQPAAASVNTCPPSWNTITSQSRSVNNRSTSDFCNFRNYRSPALLTRALCTCLGSLNRLGNQAFHVKICRAQSFPFCCHHRGNCVAGLRPSESTETPRRIYGKPFRKTTSGLAATEDSV